MWIVFPELEDFYSEHDEFTVLESDRDDFKKLVEELDQWELELLKTQRYFYVVDFENTGGLVMPLILKLVYADGEEEVRRLPAEIWKKSEASVSRLLVLKKELRGIELDPYLETSDVDRSNNSWGGVPMKGRFQLEQWEAGKNLMRKMQKEAEEKEKKEAEEKEKEEAAGEED